MLIDLWRSYQDANKHTAHSKLLVLIRLIVVIKRKDGVVRQLAFNQC